MILYYKKYGQGYPLIILHGLYGSGDNWQTMGKKLSENAEVYLIDQRNHGNSPHENIHTYNSMAEDLYQLFEFQNIKKATILGHSMGGKTAMFFTQLFPELVNRLIIVDISPRSYNNSFESREHYFILENLQKINFKICKSYSDINLQLHNYLHDERLCSFLLKSIKREGKGCFSWKINIPVLIKELPEIFKGIDENSIIEVQSLFVKGELSNHIQENDIKLIQKIFLNSEVVTIKKAGHWVHAEQPSEFLNVINTFLQS